MSESGSSALLMAVLDTNVLVSALCLPRSMPAQLLDRWMAHEYLLVLSDSILRELSDVLARPKIVKRFGITQEQSGGYLDLLCEFSLMTEGKLELSAVPNDPQDNHVVACAVEGRANMIISGDRHLQELKQYAAIGILSPAQFLAILQEQQKIPLGVE